MQSTRRRVSYNQLHNLWAFLSKHRKIAVGGNKTVVGREYSTRMWQKVADILNSTGDGIAKTGLEWSKVCHRWCDKYVYWNCYLEQFTSNTSLFQTQGGHCWTLASPINNFQIDRIVVHVVGRCRTLRLPVCGLISRTFCLIGSQFFVLWNLAIATSTCYLSENGAPIYSLTF